MFMTDEATLDLLSRHIVADLQVAGENVGLMVYRAVGRGDKEFADFLATDTLRSQMFQDRRKGYVINGEGQKDNAPGLFRGDELGNPDFPCDYVLGLAIDPIDGTTNAAAGKPNSGCYIAGVLSLDPTMDPYSLMPHLSADRCWKLAIGPEANFPKDIDPEASPTEIINRVRFNLRRKPTVVVLDREYNQDIISELTEADCNLKLISDGDIAPCVAACLPDSSVDVCLTRGGLPEMQIAVPAVYNLYGHMWARQWAKTEEEKTREGFHENLLCLDELMTANGSTRAFFVAAGITDSSLLKGVRKTRHYLCTESLSIRGRSRTIRTIRSKHSLRHKRIFSLHYGREVGLEEY